MAQKIAGTFAAASGTAAGLTSDILVIPTGVTTAIATITGPINTSNRVHLQKSTDNGQTWATQNNLSTVQTGLAITVAAGEHWRALQATSQAGKSIQYSLSVES